MNAIEIILSFGITWGIGLGIPAIVRYAIYRRALFRDEAMGWAVGLTLANFVFFISLGSQSKTHAVLILIGFITYRLLQRASGPWDKIPSDGTGKEVNTTPPLKESNSFPAASIEAPALPYQFKLDARVALERRRLSGWSRIFIVLWALWFSVVGLRIGFELSGKTYDLYLVQKNDPPADFNEGDILDYEHRILLELGTASAIARKKRIDEDANVPNGSFESEFIEFRDRQAREKREMLASKLRSFTLPELTQSDVRELSAELSVPEETIRKNESLVRQLLFVRLRHDHGVIGSKIRFEVFGERGPTYSIVTSLVVLVALGSVLALLASWWVIAWIHRGFSTSRNH